ncbi:CBS domain-containing protein [Salinibacillus kushneri]|uniref:CBS domain-containing protein n=1 Tax=Salinibacillus kushneri TaxID=237682 RepID=A0A1I0I1D7_9BACI|nr:CBS domain-containing protein [Salinibacillus kushneri]SET89491.1 CBS domain-containing protein [Salinibacillus kushneri]
MFVKGIMIPKHHCVVAEKSDRLKTILDILLAKDIQGVPVVDEEKFIGMISKQMIYQSYFHYGDEMNKETFLNSKKALDIVDYEDLHITEQDVFESTLTTFKGFPILAVTDDDKNFLGIVTRYDVLEQFESAFGMKKKGVRIAFASIEAEGRIAKLAELIRNHHGNIISLATFDETDKLARRIVLKLENHENIDRFLKRLEKSGFRILDVKNT